MNILVILLILLLNNLAQAEWVCSKSSGYRSENTYFICGVAEANSEATARSAALQNSFSEFKELCSKSYDCRNREVKLSQHRTDCSENQGRFKCLRMIEIEVTNKMKSMDDPDYLEDPADVPEQDINWNQATTKDLTNASFTAGLQGTTGTFKDFKNIAGTGIFLGVSKRFFHHLGLQLGGIFGGAKTSNQTPTTMDYYGYQIGLPVYYSLNHSEVSLAPGFYYLETSFEKNNQKTSNQRQFGLGIEFGFNHLFYFAERDRYYIGFSPKVAIINYGDSQKLKAQNPAISGILGLTLGFR